MVEKSFKQFIDVSKRLGKILICGDEGTGKTLLSVSIAVEKMLRGMEDCWESYKQVDEYNKMGFNFSKDYDHLVFANHDITSKYTKVPDRKSYKVNPFKVGLFDDEFQTDLYPPGATFFITEAHIPFNAYMWQYVRPSVTGYWTTSRQYNVSLVMDTNRPNMVVNTIRDLCNRFIVCLGAEEIKKEQFVVGHKIHVIEFKNNGEFTHYLQTGKKDNGEEYIIRINACRYENYDSHLCRFLHLKGRELEDFCIEHFPEFKSIEDIECFGEKSHFAYCKRC